MKIAVLMFSILFLSCKNKSEITDKKYFDLSNLIDTQAKQLNKQNPKVIKSWKLDSAEEQKEVSVKDWNKELSIFKESDLNKRAFLNSYTVTNKDLKSIYTLKPGENLPVKSMEIVKNPDASLAEIFIIKSEKNYLYTDSTKMLLKIKQNNLAHYTIDSYQKIIFISPKKSTITCKILN